MQGALPARGLGAAALHRRSGVQALLLRKHVSTWQRSDGRRQLQRSCGGGAASQSGRVVAAASPEPGRPTSALPGQLGASQEVTGSCHHVCAWLGCSTSHACRLQPTALGCPPQAWVLGQRALQPSSPCRPGARHAAGRAVRGVRASGPRQQRRHVPVPGHREWQGRRSQVPEPAEVSGAWLQRQGNIEG